MQFSVFLAFLVFATEQVSAKFSTEDVTFLSHGEKIAGRIFHPKKSLGLGIVVVGYQMGTKEMVASRYAKDLADMGLTALVFDPRTFGSSGGEPRQYENPEWKVDDIRAAVKFLKSRNNVNPNQLSVLGICCGAGQAARAATIDPDIKALILVAGNIQNQKSYRTELKDSFDILLDLGTRAEKKYQTEGQLTYVPVVDVVSEDVVSPGIRMFTHFMSFGLKGDWVYKMATLSYRKTLLFDSLGAAPSIKVPTLVVHSSKAISPETVRHFYKDLRASKKEIWLDDCDQVDFFETAKCIRPTLDATIEYLKNSFTPPG